MWLQNEEALLAR